MAAWVVVALVVMVHSGGGGGGDGGVVWLGLVILVGNSGLGCGSWVVVAWVGWPWRALLMVVWVVVVVVTAVGLVACCGWLCMSLANVSPFGTAVYAGASVYICGAHCQHSV